MFAKAAVFFALVAFVNAAPIVDLRPIVNPITDPIVRLPHPIKITLPVVSKRGSDTLEISPDTNTRPGADLNAAVYYGVPFPKRDLTLDVSNSIAELGSDIGAAFNFDLHLPKRDLNSQLVDFLKAIASVNVNKREAIDLDTFGSQILNGLKTHGLDEYVDHFSVRIQRLKDLLSGNTSRLQITAEANNLLLEYHQILAGLHVNKPVEARDVVIDVRVLSQLQNFVTNTVNLLRALGKSGAVSTFLSEVNNLKNEAQNGTLDVGDLLSAARDIVLSIL